MLPSWRVFRRQRVVLAFLILGLLYLLALHNRTGFPLPPTPSDLKTTPAGQSERLPLQNTRPTEDHGTLHVAEGTFDGPVQFSNLAPSLTAASLLGHTKSHVLFLASSLKSVSHLVPLACEMGRQNKNNVHMALFGRENVTPNTVMEMNGIQHEDCPVVWHDARPDFASSSTNRRMAASVKAAMRHFKALLLPEVAIVDDATYEDSFFPDAVHDRAADQGLSVITVPAGAYESMRWMTRLDASSLKSWDSVHIDILVSAPPESSASLVRLLRSIQNADYFGQSVPRLIVELPANVDLHTMAFLSRFQWPPGASGADSKLVLRRRIRSKYSGRAEASLHGVEAFYPLHMFFSHVLVLTSQAELSPAYYHFLMYTILEYKHNLATSGTFLTNRMMGISLDSAASPLDSVPHNGNSPPAALFLRQAPNSNAALYFGDKWAELHSFLSHRLSVHAVGAAAKDELSATGESQPDPSWMVYAQELMRARGYSMLYPAFTDANTRSLVTVHKELYQPPEELVEEHPPDAPISSSVLSGVDILTGDEDVTSPRGREPTTSTSMTLLSLLSPESDETAALPDLTTLPLLSHGGESLSVSRSEAEAFAYANRFSTSFGGCKPSDQRNTAEALWSAADLFCGPVSVG